MDPIDKLVAGLKHVDELIAEDVMEPDLARSDWSGMRARVKLLSDAVEGDLLGSLDDALFSVQEADVTTLIKRRVAGVLGEASAPVFATGDTKTFQSLLSKAAQIAADDEQRAIVEAGSAQPEAFCRLQHARWLQKRGRFNAADPILKRVAREAERPALKNAAKKARSGPRPIERAPSLFRVNGCGTGLYGERDNASDGSYVATYCLCILWIPIFPLTAYRVRQVDSNTYQFSAKEPLGPIARAWRAIVLAGAAIGIGAMAVNSYLESATHRAEVAMREAKESETAGDRAGALQRYKAAIGSFSGSTDVTEAAKEVVRISAEGVQEPATAASIDQISRVMNGFSELPATARAGAPAALLVSKMCAWSDQIGDAKPSDAAAGLAVLDMAAKVGDEGSASAPINERRAKKRRAIADKVAEERPLFALQHYTQIHDAPAVEASKAILDTFGDAPSLWLEAEPELDRFVEDAAKVGKGSYVDVAATKLKRAQEVHAEDEALLKRGDEKAITKALVERPGDQELAVALAGAARARGDVKGATATLTKLGAPGRMTAEAQLLLGQCYADAGDLAQADGVISTMMSERLPLFQAAQRELFGAAQKLRESLVARAKLGMMPKEIEAKMRTASDDEQVAIFGEYVRDSLDANPDIAAQRAEYLRHGVVVPGSLTLGTVKLRRAREASGAERKALLDEAERAFLAIRAEAEGQPSFHMGLGQVYHRLGRTEEGDKELQGVLDRQDDELSLQVAHVYRELGLVRKARQLAEQIHKDGKAEAARRGAALLRAHVPDDLEDQATWLARCDQSSPYVKNLMTENEAGRLEQAGKLAEADKVYAKVIAWHERSAKTDPAAANNAAVGYSTRYSLTGDIAHLKSAVDLLSASVKLSGDNAITLGNLAEALEHLGLVTVAERWVHPRTLMLDSTDAESLFDTLVSGPMRAEVIDALSKDPSYRRALEVTKQEQILAPQKVSAYLKQLRWLRWSRDTEGLADLEKKLAAMPPMRGEEAAEGRRAFATGEKDDELKKSWTARVARAKERLARAVKEGHKPTIAAAWQALGDSQGLTVYWDPTPASLDERVDAYKKAREAWQEGSPESEVTGALLISGAIKAMDSSPALKKAWAADGRTLDLGVLLHRSMMGESGEEVKAALRKQPDLVEAARIRKASLAGRPTLTDWVLARVVGDSEMEQASAAAFERAELGFELAIEARLYPGLPREAAQMDLFKSKGKGGSP